MYFPRRNWLDLVTYDFVSTIILQLSILFVLFYYYYYYYYYYAWLKLEYIHLLRWIFENLFSYYMQFCVYLMMHVYIFCFILPPSQGLGRICFFKISPQHKGMYNGGA
jgi:hypothetical protein